MLKYNFDSKLEKTKEYIKKIDYFIDKKSIDLLSDLFKMAIKIDNENKNAFKKSIMIDEISDISSNIKIKAIRKAFLEKFAYYYFSIESQNEFYNNSEYSNKLSNAIIDSTPYLIYKYMYHFPNMNKEEMINSILKIGNPNNLCLCAEEFDCDLKKIEDAIIKSNDAYAILRFASIDGVNLDRLTNAIIKTNDERCIYSFSSIDGVNIELIEDTLINLNSIKYLCDLAQNCKSANLDKITNFMLNYRKNDTIKQLNYNTHIEVPDDFNDINFPHTNSIIYMCKYFCEIKSDLIDDVFGSKEDLLLLMYNLTSENNSYNTKILYEDIKILKKQINEYNYEKNYKNYVKKITKK